MALGCAIPQARAADHPDLSGGWVLNVPLSEHPEQVGFESNGRGGNDDPGAGRQRGGGVGGGFGGRAGGRGGGGGFGRGAGGSRGARGNTDDRLKVLELSDEARNPPARIEIAMHGEALTVSDGEHKPRTFHPTGKKETQELEAVKVDDKTTWDGARLVVAYDAGNGRTIRYSYSIVPDARQLLVEVVFDTGGKEPGHTAQPIKRIYDPDQ